MVQANTNDPATIERIYPREAFDQDVGRNSQAKAVAHHGVRIASQPDPQGSFTLMRASRHVGEEAQEIGSIFLAPTRSYDAPFEPGASAYGGSEERGDGIAAELDSAAKAYREFVQRILEAARSAHFEKLDPNDARLKGFHGG